MGSEFGLSVNFAKTKFIVAGVGASAGDGAALVVAGQSVQSVSSFVYLGSAISPDSRIAGEIDRCLLSNRNLDFAYFKANNEMKVGQQDSG